MPSQYGTIVLSKMCIVMKTCIMTSHVSLCFSCIEKDDASVFAPIVV